ncbi:transmembrane emp24 domain-containing protein 5 [Drosophila tropicalis]|uniref:transmembrane emp24 domain-containing protein 5 n=1 Tax=Drosophila tropicalis TaxID=46794 RepID=UPI0035ABF738
MFQIVRGIRLFLAFIIIAINYSLAEPYNKQLTIFAEPGRMECYHQPIAATELITIDYQVIHGGHGEAHINFMLMDPKRGVLVAEEKQDKSKHKLVANETGSYKLCFDNTISTFNRKIVTFLLEVVAANYEEQERINLRKEMLTDYQFDKAFTNIVDDIGKIQVHLMRARQNQDSIRAHEARDRNLAESNYAMVNNWSLFQFLAMIVVGMLQVFMLRSIFHTDGRFYKFWQRF